MRKRKILRLVPQPPFKTAAPLTKFLAVCMAALVHELGGRYRTLSTAEALEALGSWLLAALPEDQHSVFLGTAKHPVSPLVLMGLLEAQLESLSDRLRVSDSVLREVIEFASVIYPKLPSGRVDFEEFRVGVLDLTLRVRAAASLRSMSPADAAKMLSLLGSPPSPKKK